MLGLTKQAASLAPVGSKLVRNFGASTVSFAKRRDPSLPVAPKNSSTPYTLFGKDWFPANKDQHHKDGKFDLPTASAAMSSAWAALTSDVKQTYTDKAKEAKKIFDAEYKKWHSGLDAETIKAIEESTGKKVSPPGGKKGSKQAERDRPGNPGRPLTAFFEFMNEYRNGEGQGVPVTEAAKKGGEKWREMSEDDKQKYKDTAAEKKSKYLEWQKTLQ